MLLKIIVKFFFIALTVITLNACTLGHSADDGHKAVSANSAANTSKNLGAMTQSQLLARKDIFYKKFNAHQVDQDHIQLINSISQPTKVLIVFGLWCHDSQREIPRLLKLLSEANNPNIEVAMISVGYDKVIPESANQHNVSIKYTPTVIVFDQEGKELKRFVERPNTLWATDLAAAHQ